MRYRKLSTQVEQQKIMGSPSSLPSSRPRTLVSGLGGEALERDAGEAWKPVTVARHAAGPAAIKGLVIDGKRVYGEPLL
jgi:hypothetical protein